MTSADTLAERRAYLDGGLAEVDCARCGARVRAKKASLQQTSVQWNAAAQRACPELRARAAAGQPTALLPGCPNLRDSIERAARDGRLEIR